MRPLIQGLRDLFFRDYRYNTRVRPEEFLRVCENELASLRGHGQGRAPADQQTAAAQGGSGSGSGPQGGFPRASALGAAQVGLGGMTGRCAVGGGMQVVGWIQWVGEG
jgi:hypothetical protein